MPRFFLALALLGSALAGGWHYWPWRELRYGAGQVVAPSDPEQHLVPEQSLGTVAGYELTRLAEYSITARVLSSRRYRYQVAHELAPIDLALGWGRMSDEAVLDSLEISQGFRFYFYEWRRTPPIPPEEIARHSANTHIIPATPEVESIVCGLPRGAVVKMSGDLVRANNSAGFAWVSSLSRDDVGAGACELFYVRQVERVTWPKQSGG